MNAGKINKDWLSDARGNETPDSTVEDWFAEATNMTVEIDEEGSVWCVESNSWLGQDRIDQICKAMNV